MFQIYEMFKEAGPQFGCETANNSTPEYDVTEQIASFDQALAQNPKRFLVHPMNSAPFIEPINRVVDQGTAVVTFAADSPLSKRASSITSDNERESTYAVDAAANPFATLFSPSVKADGGGWGNRTLGGTMRNLQSICRFLGSAALCLSLGVAAKAQERLPLQGPGLGNLEYTEAELMREISRIDWDKENGIPAINHTIAGRNNPQKPYGINVGIMLNGYFVTAFAPDSGEATGGFLIYDVSDPRKIKRVKTVFEPNGVTSQIREPHAFGLSTVNGRTYLAMSTITGVEFWDFTDVNDIKRAGSLALPGVNGGDYENVNWQMWWQAPYLYVSGASRGLYIVDAKDPTKPELVNRGPNKPNPIPTGSLGGFRIGPIFTMGNTMVLTGMETRSGFATLDISDPKNPVPIAAKSQLPFYYATCYNGRHLYSSGRNADGFATGFDLLNPRQIVVENENTPVNDGLYCATQDDYMIIGAQRQIIKYNVTDPKNYVMLSQSEVVADNRTVQPRGNRDPDLGQVAMFGNLVFVGSDHGTNTAFRPHQLGKDVTPPAVINVSPANGAVRQATTTRVGIALSDSILYESVNSDSFILRERGTNTPISGSYSAQLGIVNFFPDEPLTTNKEYEIILPKGGLRDYAGNALEEAFVSRFTTGAEDKSDIKLLHHWPLAASLIDLPGGVNGMASSSDIFANGAIDLTGRTSGVMLNSDHIADTLGATATVSFRMQTTQRGSNQPWLAPGIFGRDQDSGSSDIFWGWIDASGHINLSVGNRTTTNPGVRSTNPINDGRWHTIVMTRDADSGEQALFVDGVKTSSRSDAGIVGIADKLQMLGQIHGNPVSYQGLLSDVKIHNGVLSDSQILRLFHSGTIQLADNIVGQTATFDPAALLLTGARYIWNLGDGSAVQTTTAASPVLRHQYSQPGNYNVSVRVVDAAGNEELFAFRQIVTHPKTAFPASHTSNIIGDAKFVYSLDPDAGTITAISKVDQAKAWELSVGKNPQTLALDNKGRIWVAVHGDDKLVRIEPLTRKIASFNMGYGAAPYGVAFTRDGTGLVTFAGKAQFVTFNPNSGVVSFKLNLPTGDYRGIAVSGDSRFALVTRFRATSQQAEIYKIDLQNVSGAKAAKLIALPVDRETIATEAKAPGVANYLHQVVIAPDGRKAFVPSKKDNVVDGQFRNGQVLKSDTTVRSILSTIDLASDREVFSEQIDFNNRAPARAVLFAPKGNYLFVAQAESNSVEVVDPFTRAVIGVLPGTEQSPHGLYLDEASSTLYINNFLARSVTIHDVSRVLSGDNVVAPSPKSIKTVEKEPLTAEVLAGKKLFYNAADPRMTSEMYMSCASCHIDGDSDGTVWDFTQRGEGLRRTISLQGRQGLGDANGRLHWSANFDEIQDFEKDIREEFDGAGFMSDADYEATIDPLGKKKAGLSKELDNLAAYITSLKDFSKSPHRDAKGCLTPQARSGQTIFKELSCASCHGTPTVSDNKRHDIGTLQASSGMGSGEALKDKGIDTPSLHGLWEGASFLHNGQAQSLEEVFNQDSRKTELTIAKVHGGAIAAHQIAPLVAYLKSLDGENSCDAK